MLLQVRFDVDVPPSLFLLRRLPPKAAVFACVTCVLALSSPFLLRLTLAVHRIEGALTSLLFAVRRRRRQIHGIAREERRGGRLFSHEHTMTLQRFGATKEGEKGKVAKRRQAVAGRCRVETERGLSIHSPFIPSCAPKKLLC